MNNKAIENQIEDSDECECLCHSDDFHVRSASEHQFPCCGWCDNCHNLIDLIKLEDHKKSCCIAGS